MVQRELQQILVHMFPFKAARIKADIQQQACREVGQHTPALWQSVVVIFAELSKTPHLLAMLYSGRLCAIEIGISTIVILTPDDESGHILHAGSSKVLAAATAAADSPASQISDRHR